MWLEQANFTEAQDNEKTAWLTGISTFSHNHAVLHFSGESGIRTGIKNADTARGCCILRLSKSRKKSRKSAQKKGRG